MGAHPSARRVRRIGGQGRTPVGLCCHGQCGEELAGVGNSVPVPTRVDMREPKFQPFRHQSRHIRQCRAKCQIGIATIVDGIPDLLVATRHIDRLYNPERSGELNHAASVSRCFVEVHDHGIEWIVRVDFEGSRTDQSLKRSSVPELRTSGIRLSLLNDEASHACVSNNCRADVASD